MKENKASVTAMCTTMYKAAELQRPENDRLYSDTYATAFLPPFVLTILKSKCLTRCFFWFLFERKLPGAITAVLARARYIDNYLASYIRERNRQVVILGAGYDTRAYRSEFQKNDIRVFELDHPMTQSKKKYCIRNFFKTLPQNVTYVPINFETESLLEKLLENGYDKTLNTLFIWEGVTKYLSKEAVEAVFACVTKHSATGSSIVFDYVYCSTLFNGSEKKVFDGVEKYQNKINEPFRFGLDKATIQPYIMAQGFSRVDNIDLTELKELFSCGHRRRWPEVSFGGIVCAVV